MDRIERAVQYFQDRQSCSQAVLLAFHDKLGLDKTTALKLAAGFGGGMGMGETCGAATGAFMVLGLMFDPDDVDARDKMHALTHEFAERFKLYRGSLVCRELIGCEIYTPEGKEYFKQSNLRADVCEQLVREAAAITQELLQRSQQ